MVPAAQARGGIAHLNGAGHGVVFGHRTHSLPYAVQHELGAGLLDAQIPVQPHAGYALGAGQRQKQDYRPLLVVDLGTFHHGAHLHAEVEPAPYAPNGMVRWVDGLAFWPKWQRGHPGRPATS